MASLSFLDPSKDLYNLTAEELRDFFAYKEAQYTERRERIQAACNTIKNVFGALKESRMMRVNPEVMVYDAKDSVAYCVIAKVK